jgi:tRNA 2-selenouridine synthase
MPEVISAEAFREILLNNTPLIDARAPVEFNKGSLPSATNLPLLNDKERMQVGIRYREAGQNAAIQLGEALVSGTIREQRLQEWMEFVERHPDALLFCFRGGLRSQTVQTWLARAGVDIPRVAGGYKALRRYLLNVIEEVCACCSFILVAGKTGCAKTQLVNSSSPSIDLEGLANHRGSAFGRRVQPQPTQINFESALAIALLRLPYEQYCRIILEDESHAIGSVSLPQELFSSMSKSPVAVIEEPLSYRVDTVLRAYIQMNFSDYLHEDAAHAEARFSEYLLDSLQRIRTRLGQELYSEILQDLNEALRQHLQHQDSSAHGTWIEKLLRDYYDPMYEYQLQKKQQRIVFRGNSEEFQNWTARLQYRNA